MKPTIIPDVPALIEQVSGVSSEAKMAQQMAEFRNQAMRHAERMAKYSEWVKPEEIAKRLLEHEEKAAEALEAGRKASKKIREEFGLPSDDPLLPENIPKHMRGQAASTIRAMLRQESWKYNKDLAIWEKKKDVG